MPRPLAWSRDLYSLRDKVRDSKIQVWKRSDIRDLFYVSRGTAQTIMRAIGVDNIAGNYVVERSELEDFLEQMIAADDLEKAFAERLGEARTPPKSKPILIPLPPGLKNVRFEDLPPNIKILPGRLEIHGDGFAILESLAILSKALQSDVDLFLAAWNKDLDIGQKVAAFVDKFRDSTEADESRHNKP